MFNFSQIDFHFAHYGAHTVTNKNILLTGHGLDLTDRIYYVKESVDEPVVITRPLGLEPPCDTDDTQLTEEQCSEAPTEAVTSYECSNVQTTYLSTIQQVSDIKCPGEDRILQCELKDGKAGSNIDVKTRQKLLQDAFLKSFEDPNVSVFSKTTTKTTTLEFFSLSAASLVI